jgi:hypothetical protein
VTAGRSLRVLATALVSVGTGTLVLVGVSMASSSHANVSAAPTVLAFDRTAIGRIRPIGIARFGNTWPTATGYPRYAYVLVGRQAAAAAARQPGTSLVYHSAPSVNTEWDAGIPYAVALAKGWLLSDASGELLRNVRFPTSFVGDVGSPEYASEWAGRVARYLARVGVDGVYIDDVVGDPTNITGGRFPARYPSQAAWEDAMVSFVRTVGTALKSRGFYVLANAHKWIEGHPDSDNGRLEAQFWRRLAPWVSGLQTEYWLQDPTNVARVRGLGPEWWNNWDGWQRLVRVTQSAGADFFGFTYGSPGDTRAMRFGKASFLLDWDGDGGAFIFALTERGDPWHPDWTSDLGRPIRAKSAVAPGVWTRRFERGRVIVNATMAPVTVTVDGVSKTIASTDAVMLAR